MRQAVATPAQIAADPKGNLNHRYWRCLSEPMQGARERWATSKDRQIEAECDVSGRPAWERGMIPRPSLPRAKAASEESCKWKVRLEGGMFEGDIYLDGSALDGPAVELTRCGWWSFVVLCQKIGKAIA